MSAKNEGKLVKIWIQVVGAPSPRSIRIANDQDIDALLTAVPKAGISLVKPTLAKVDPEEDAEALDADMLLQQLLADYAERLQRKMDNNPVLFVVVPRSGSRQISLDDIYHALLESHEKEEEIMVEAAKLSVEGMDRLMRVLPFRVRGSKQYTAIPPGPTRTFDWKGQTKNDKKRQFCQQLHSMLTDLGLQWSYYQLLNVHGLPLLHAGLYIPGIKIVDGTTDLCLTLASTTRNDSNARLLEQFPTSDTRTPNAAVGAIAEEAIRNARFLFELKVHIKAGDEREAIGQLICGAHMAAVPASPVVQVCLTDGEMWRFYSFSNQEVCVVVCGSWEQAAHYIVSALQTKE